MSARVVAALKETASQDPQRLREASNILTSLLDTEQDQLVETICQAVLSDSGVDEETRLVGCIFLKNAVRSRWDLHDDPKGMQPQSREILKQRIIPMIMKSAPHIKVQLFDILKQMTREDFPNEWFELLPHLLQQYYNPFLEKVNSGSIPTDLDETANAIMIMHTTLSKYEQAFRSNEILIALKKILITAAPQLLMMFTCCTKLYVSLIQMKTGGQENLSTPNGRGDEYICVVCQMATASLEIIKFLHGVDLPEYFEDHLKELAEGCFELIKSPPSSAVDDCPRKYLTDNTERITLTEKSRIACCELIREYVTKYSEEFAPYVGVAFAHLMRLLQESSTVSQDELASAALVALASILTITWGDTVNFNELVPNFLARICEDIIIPNISIREDDVEAMEDDPLQYARDIWEGNQRGARREGVNKLISAMLQRYLHATRALVFEVINKMLMSSNSSGTPAQRDLIKEMATFLIVAISSKTSTAARGTTEVYEAKPVIEFLESQVLPTLRENVVACASNESVLLRCSCLKYVCNFRHIVPPNLRVEILSLVVAHLSAESVLIHTIAAASLERLLTAGLDGAPLVPVQSAPVLSTLSAAVAPLMSHVGGEVNTMDNEYVMKCLWKVLLLTPGDVTQYVAHLQRLCETLKQVAAKPVNPQFCHFLFEAVAVVSKSVARALPPQEVESVHKYVIDAMVHIISEEESHASVPYCYQVLAGLLETIPMQPPADDAAKKSIGGVAELYMPIISTILNKDRWTASASNVPGIMSVLSMVLSRWWIWGPTLSQRLPDFVRLSVFAMNHKKIPPKLTFDYLGWVVASFPPESFAPSLEDLLVPLLQHTDRNSRRGGISNPVIMFSLGAICGIMMRFDVQVSGRLGHFGNAQYPEALDVIKVLERKKQGVVINFLQTFFLPATEEVVLSRDKRLLLAGVISFMSHPVVKANRQISENLAQVAGHLIKDQSLSESARDQKKMSVSPEEEREEMLKTMAANDESGLVDASATYNRLSSTSKTIQENPLVTLASDALLQTGLTDAMAYQGFT